MNTEIFLNRYSKNTRRSYEGSINLFDTKFGIENIGTIKTISLLEFQDELHKTMKASSVNAHFRNLKAFANFLLNCEEISQHYFGKVKSLKEEKKVPQYFTEEEIASILLVAKEEERLMFIVMLYTGVRRGELINIKLSDINDGILIVHGKGEKQREIPISENLAIEIENYMKTRKCDSEYLIVSRRKENGEQHQITESSVYTRMKSLAKRANIDEKRISAIRPHNVRKTFATYLIDENVGIETVQQLLGHGDITTTIKSYGSVRKKTKKVAVGTLNFGKKENE